MVEELSDELKYHFSVPTFSQQYTVHLPWYSARFHHVGKGDVVGPDIKLPLPET